MVHPKILCIDDDPEITSIIRARLEPYQVDVLRAFNGMQGFWTAVSDQPAVIVSDLNMPDGQGNYVFSRMQSHPLTREIPFIVLTGESNPAVKRTLLSLGVAAYLRKPFAITTLLNELKQYIDIPERQPDQRPFNVSDASLMETTLYDAKNPDRRR